MELLSNLAWLAVALALWSAWITRWRRHRPASLLPRICVQLVALGVLTAILLPVISISDDLQASHNPAEVERSVTGRNEHILVADAAQPSTPLACAVLVACMMPPLPRQRAFLAAEEMIPLPMEGHLRALESRPPPVV